MGHYRNKPDIETGRYVVLSPRVCERKRAMDWESLHQIIKWWTIKSEQ
ncbi:hypothetical protein [Bartonella sp. B41]